mgnify:CR=1 FL=1
MKRDVLAEAARIYCATSFARQNPSHCGALPAGHRDVAALGGTDCTTGLLDLPFFSDWLFRPEGRAATAHLGEAEDILDQLVKYLVKQRGWTGEMIADNVLA